MRRVVACILFTVFAIGFSPGALGANHRLIILADMGNEPDEEQQMMHMLMYANEFDLEGLIAVTGKYLRTRPQPERFHKLIDGYAQVVDNLRKHADGWPDVEYLHRITVAGQQKYGTADVGPGKTSAGSELILEAAMRKDPRPLHIVVNAGSNTLAQALWDFRRTHSPEQVDGLVARLRVFENGSQDNAGAWICHHLPRIHWIRSNYQTYCYGGPANDGSPESRGRLGPHTWKPYAYSPLGQHQWALEHVIAHHGALGRLFPLRLFRRGQLAFIEGGGTIPWMGLVHKGVYDADHPHWGSFSGRFSREKVENYWSRHADIKPDEKKVTPFHVHREAADRWTNPETGETFENEYIPVWRWRRAMFNDFRGRMDWCVKPPDQANHNPVAAFRGNRSDEIVRLTARPGEAVGLDASASTDPDGDELRFNWFVYPEAGTYRGEVSIAEPTAARTTMLIPADAAGTELHVILQVADRNRIASMFDFRRVVVDVTAR